MRSLGRLHVLDKSELALAGHATSQHGARSCLGRQGPRQSKSDEKTMKKSNMFHSEHQNSCAEHAERELDRERAGEEELEGEERAPRGVRRSPALASGSSP